jgi:putative transposase
VPEEALDLFGKPEIFNTDQGSRFTSQAFTSVLRVSVVGRPQYMRRVLQLAL